MKIQGTISSILAIAFVSFAGWMAYGAIFPKRVYKPGETLSQLQIVASRQPYFHFTGLDDPHFYVLSAQHYKNDFRISREVLDLIGDNDTIRRTIKANQPGDTLWLSLDASGVNRLQQGSGDVEIIGLASKDRVLIDPANIEKHYKERRADNWFTLIVAGI